MSESTPPPGKPGPIEVPQPAAPEQVMPVASPPPGAPVGATAKKKSKLVIAIAVAATLVVSGMVFTAMTLLRKPASIPAAKVLPADTMSVISIDLNPSTSDQKAVSELADKFSDIENLVPKDSSGYKQTAWEFMADGYYSSPWGYLFPPWEEVDDWVGDNVALASGYWSSDREDEYSPLVNVIAIQYTNAEKAEAAVEEWVRDTHFSYVFVDDYVLIVSEMGNLDRDSIKNESLSKSKRLQDRLGKLNGGSYLATAWVASQGFRGNPFSFKHERGMVPSDIPSSSEIAFGVRMSGTDVQMDAVTWQDAKLEGKPESVDDLVGGLPDDASAALGFSASDAMLKSLDDSLFALPSDLDPWDPFSGVREILRDLGISSGKQFRDLIGQKAALYFPKRFPDDVWQYSATYDYEDLHFGMVAKLKDAKDYEDAWDDLLSSPMLYADGTVKHEAEGEKVYSGWAMSPDDLQKVSDKLSDAETYKQVINNAGGAHLIAFVDGDAVKSFYSRDERQQRMARKLTGVGLVGKQLDDHYGQFTLRIGLKK